jgi:hypothetical protein
MSEDRKTITMSSKEPSDLLDLETGIPTTEEDIRFLRENRPGPLTFEELQAIVDQIPNLQEILRRRPVPQGEPFEL